MNIDKSQPAPEYGAGASGQPPPYPVDGAQPGYPSQPQPGYSAAQLQPGYSAAQTQPGYSNPAYPVYTSATSGVITQPQTVVISNPVYSEPHPDSTAQIIFSCLVIWCCFCCLGLPAFIIAIMSSSDYNVESARSKLRIANILNVIGLVIGVCLHLFWIILTIVAIASE